MHLVVLCTIVTSGAQKHIWSYYSAVLTLLFVYRIISSFFGLLAIAAVQRATSSTARSHPLRVWSLQTGGSDLH